MIPNRETCIQMMASHEMLPNIKEHSILVADVALLISRELNKNGAAFDLNIIEAAALLHDITKTKSINTGENHSKSGGELLRKISVNNRIAEIVGQHMIPDKIEGMISEEEVVCYADKRVLHDKVVSLEKRFDYLVERYGINDKAIESINKTRKKLLLIEKRIIESSASTEFDINKIIV